MADVRRYRITRAAFDVVSVYGSLGALSIPGPVFPAVLAARGYSASYVRNQLTQLVQRGAMRATSCGRVTLYELTEPVLTTYNKLSAIPPEVAEGHTFFSIIHRVPERERTLRDRILYVAGMAGFQQLRPGVLIAMRDGEQQVRSTFEDAELAGRIEFCRMVAADREQARRWVAVAWDTDQVKADIDAAERSVAALEDDAKATETQYFDLFHAVSMLQLRTPDIPAYLAPDLQALERLGNLQSRLISLYAERYAGPVFDRILPLPAASMIVYDDAFWQRVAGASRPPFVPATPGSAVSQEGSGSELRQNS